MMNRRRALTVQEACIGYPTKRRSVLTRMDRLMGIRSTVCLALRRRAGGGEPT
jgi:hypothetical protein